jgi:hypothetical protein
MLTNALALVAGIANYQYVNPLPPTVLDDARGEHEVLVDKAIAGYMPDTVRLLLNGEATGSALRQALSDMRRRCNADSTALIYLSCHGGRIDSGPHRNEYLLPVDADIRTHEALARSAVSGTEFTEVLRSLPARQVVVIFDCCHAGGIGQPKDVAAPTIKAGLPERYYETLAAGRGRAILASSRSDEYSYVMPGASNSLFTEYLLAGLRGDIPSDDGLIRVFDVFEYVQPRVTAAHPRQHPVFKAELEENFPVALRLGGQIKAVPRDKDGYRYDAYVLYAEKSERDLNWVWANLIPALEQAGLRIAVSDDVLQPGVARVATIKQGMLQARRTVVVLSQAFLTDTMAIFEATLALTIGIDLENAWRVLPVIVEPIDATELPYTLASPMMEPIDLAQPRRPQYGLPRLIAALKALPPRIL